MCNTDGERAPSYRIEVEGQLDLRWSDWFDGLSISYQIGRNNEPLSVLSGAIVDQAALHGILTSVRDLNLTLISVTRIEPEPSADGGEEERMRESKSEFESIQRPEGRPTWQRT